MSPVGSPYTAYNLTAMLQWVGLLYFLWCFVIQVVFEFINCTIVINRDLTPYQLFYNELKPITIPYRPNLKVYKAIGSYYEVLIPLKKRPKAYKVKARIESGRLLANLGFKDCLVYISIKNIVTKTLFVKLYELKNPLLLEGVSKPIGIRPLNDAIVTKDFTGERVSLDLPEIDDDDISLLEPVALEAPGPPKPSEPIAPRLSKLLKLENRSPKLVFRPFEELIKPVDSLNPDEMQLDLVTSLRYRVKIKIFKKKLDKNSFIPNIYKQTLKSLNVKEWLAIIFSEFEQLISSETFKFLLYKVLFKGRKPLTNRLVFKEKND